MFISPASRVTRLGAGAWPRRITAVLAAVTGGVLAWAAAVPAASAATILIPDPGGAYGPVPAAPGGTVRVITAGMPSWQITLIALAAALAAVVLDRARASRRAATATATR